MHGMGLLYKPITLHNNEGLFGEVASAFAVRTVPGRRPRVRAQAAGLAPGRVWWHRWQGARSAAGYLAGRWQAGPPSGDGLPVGVVLGAVPPGQGWLLIPVDKGGERGAHAGGVGQQDRAAQH